MRRIETMGKVRVKICGITTVDDAIAAIGAGADAIGLNMVSGPRRLDASRAAEILTAIDSAAAGSAIRSESDHPPVPVMLVNTADDIAYAEALKVARRFSVRTIQLYGDDRGERAEPLQREGFCIWLPHAVQPDQFPGSMGAVLSRMTIPPTAVVLDAYHRRLAGGTGIALDWRRLRDAMIAFSNWPPIILAGGLTPHNVAEAIKIVQPYAVDVSSGVESVPGRKDVEQMTRFVQSVRSAAS